MLYISGNFVRDVPQDFITESVCVARSVLGTSGSPIALSLSSNLGLVLRTRWGCKRSLRKQHD
jgi:hypothetical protein